ncbi:MAG: hypothetical protein GX180_03865, partial [Enterococcus sp.]|nr:hypothetical protein [Enterococcus sp.]
MTLNRNFEYLIFLIILGICVIDEMKKKNNVNLSGIELPPYPNRKQVKKCLKIGDDRLNHWIAGGLKMIPFGKEARFDCE